jgi:hypothetical protein
VKKHILETDTCELCNGGSEDADHIVSGCPFARSFWDKIGWESNEIAKVDDVLWTTKTRSKPPPPLLLEIVEAPT